MRILMLFRRLLLQILHGTLVRVSVRLDTRFRGGGKVLIPPWSGVDVLHLLAREGALLFALEDRRVVVVHGAPAGHHPCAARARGQGTESRAGHDLRGEHVVYV